MARGAGARHGGAGGGDPSHDKQQGSGLLGAGAMAARQERAVAARVTQGASNGVGGHGLGDTGVSGVWGGDGGARQATVIRARGCA